MTKKISQLVSVVILIGALLLVLACNLPRLETSVGYSATATIPELNAIIFTETSPTPTEFSFTQTPEQIPYTPTPDPQHSLPALRTETVQYTVKPYDTLEKIASWYTIGLNTLIQANGIQNPDLIHVGELLIVPPPQPMPVGPGYKILPDSELVNGPSTIAFDLESFILSQNGFLASYSEVVDGETLSAIDIIRQVSQNYSIGVRTLLAVLEYQSGWVTQAQPVENLLEYPLGFENSVYKGLYGQLVWAANEMNRGYYLWRVNAIAGWVLKDDSVVPPDAGINAGTAALQKMFSKIYGYGEWLEVVQQNGIFNTYKLLFGDPFRLAFEPLIPTGLSQPDLLLPFEPGQIWSFTGGPHYAYDDGAAWAGLDFAPPGEALGCVQSEAWVTAMSDGWVVRSENGLVIQDLDGDSFEQTGWVLLYLHIETRDRVPDNTYLNAGDRIGHPSCEGGISTGTHVHIARRYNGEWITADGNLPFNLEGWISTGTGIAYNGSLSRDGQTVQASTGRWPQNQIQR